MIIVAGEVKLADAGQVAQAREALGIMVAATLKETGCIIYSFAQDLVDASIIRIFERWEDQAALDAHMATPHMAAFRESLGSLKIEGLDVNSYDATLIGPIS